MKSILVIGVGRFGKHLAKKLLELGNDVMVVDKDEETIERLNGVFTDSYIGDCRNEGVIRSLGVNNFDVCFVSVDQDFQASLEITSLLKEFGAKFVVSNAKRDRQAVFLKKIGADDVIYPEREIAEKTAYKYNANNIFDFIQLTEEYSIYEVPILDGWAGKAINDINVRNKYHVNIIAVKNGDDLNPIPGASYVFRPNDHIVIIGKSTDVTKMTSKNSKKYSEQ